MQIVNWQQLPEIYLLLDPPWREFKKEKNLQQEGLGGAPLKTFFLELAIYRSDNKEETGR